MEQFRETVASVDRQANVDADYEFLQLLSNGLIAARHGQYDVGSDEAVSVSPIHTYLTQDRRADYQFWLDIGHAGWSERLVQPLTHPYILRRGYPSDRRWSDDDEQHAENIMFKNIILGLLRRCRKGVYLGYCDLNEMG